MPARVHTCPRAQHTHARAHTRARHVRDTTHWQDTTRGPAYTINPRPASAQRRQPTTPGPGTYTLSYGITRRGRFAGKHLMLHGRPPARPGTQLVSPGPGQYESPQTFCRFATRPSSLGP